MIPVSRIALLATIMAVSSCGQGPSQVSRYVDRTELVVNANDKVYSLPRGVIALSVKTETTVDTSLAIKRDRKITSKSDTKKGEATDSKTDESSSSEVDQVRFNTKITIAPPTVTMYPDTQASFAAQWLESDFASDHFTFQIAQDGLLSSNSAINKDETAQIIGKVIEIAKQAAVDLSLMSLRADQERPAPPRCGDVSATIQLDPFHDATKTFASNCFKVSVAKLDGDPILPIAKTRVAEIARQCTGGVCARLPAPVKITITGTGEGVAGASAEYVAVVPDPYTITSYDIERGPCIQRQTDFAFSSGMLTKVELQKPSEILACLDIPLNVLKAIGEIPGSVLQAKVKVINDDTSMANAQAQYLQAMTTMMNNQNALIKAVAAR